MPISEDEFEHQGSGTSHPSGMTKAELRKSNKPIMEKRRRARINHCLNELKTLILDAMKKDPARHSKLEKADILEMTVRHLQKIQRQQLALSVATDPSVLQKFKSGFNECAGEVSRFIGSMEGVETAVKQRLVAHLSTCVSGLQQISPFTLSSLSGNISPNTGFSGNNSMGGNLSIPTANSSINGVPIVVPQPPFSSGDVNNNGESARIQMPGGIQLIPSRLPTGELALLVPNSSNMPFFPSAALNSSTLQQLIPQHSTQNGDTSVPYDNAQPQSTVTSTKTSHISAFTTVTRSESRSPSSNLLRSLRPKLSPPLSPASSTASHSDDQLSSDNYKNNTPPPQIMNQSNIITSPFPTPPNHMPVLNTFRNVNVQISSETKPNFVSTTRDLRAQQPLVSSTSVSPDTNEWKIGYQAVPIYQPNEKNRHVQNANRQYESSVQNTQLPLSVITSEKYKVTMLDHCKEDNTNTVSRKRGYQEISSDSGLLAVANSVNYQTSPKVMRYSMDAVTSSEVVQSINPEDLANRSNDSSANLSFDTLPSTSANTSSASANTSGSSSRGGASTASSDGSMWRPW